MARIDGFSWRLATTNALLGLIIFFSATQLGLHFWPSSTLVYGVRIDYLSPTIYFLDILIILYLALKRSDLVGCKSNQKPTRSDLVGILAPILLVNLLFSVNPLATLSWSLHLILYSLFFATMPLTRTVLERKTWLQAKLGSAAAERTVLNVVTGSDPQRIIFTVLPLSMLFVVTLAATQVFLGHSVGGALWWLGERTVAVGAPGIATATFMGHVVLRAYATFGHPNVLAGWLVVSLLIIQRLVGQSPGSDPLRRSWPTAKMFSRLQNTIRRPGQTLLVFTLLLTIIGVLLAQSRAAAISLFGLIIPFYLIKTLKFRRLYFSIFFCSLFFVLPTGALTRASDLSLRDRLTLQGLSLSIVRTLPIFGSGAEASITTYPATSPNFRLLQPDHDSFTLFLSWFGLFGALAIIYYLKYRLGFRTWNLGFIIPLLPILLLDHYLLTSPQGLFILLLYLKSCEK